MKSIVLACVLMLADARELTQDESLAEMSLIANEQ